MSRARDDSLVKKRREELQLRLVDLASRVKRSAALISMIEGGFIPALPTMEAIAQALDTTPLALWPDEIEVTE